ncbi:MAG: phage terminase large subunit family protein [Roseomonas sp.]|nr:phage terminase large subunit family protein [Roseomonas sp.]
MLGSRASAEPGPWRTSRTPYLKDVMDALSAVHPARRVVFMKGAQVGATESGNNWLGYIMHHVPAPALAVQPTVELAKRFSRQRIDPLLEETPALRERVAPARARDSGNTMLSKEFPGGILVLTGANSAVGLRSMTARFLFLDEVDAYPGDVAGEGDPIALAEARARTFGWRRKAFLVSTPTIAGRSRIEREYLASDQRRFFVPCSECGEMQWLRFERLIWEKGAPETARYHCAACDHPMQEHDKTATGSGACRARHTAGAQDCEYDIAWTNTYLVGIDYAATANRCGNAVINRHRAPASRFQRFLAGVPNTRAAAFRQSATEVGVEGLISIATSTTTANFMADFCFNGLTDLTPTDRAVTLAANRGLGWMLDTSQAKEFALAHWLTSGASGGRLFVRVFDGAGNVREDITGDVLASITTMQWNGPAKGWNAGAPMDDANFNRRQTIRVGASVAYAQVGVIGFDGSIDLQALRLYGLPEAAPAVLNGTPLLTGALFGSGRREFAAEVSWELPSLAPGATSLIDVTVKGARSGYLAQASLVSSTRFIELDAAVWSNNTVQVMARNISGATFDLVDCLIQRIP